MGLGDAWEWVDIPEYPEKIAPHAYLAGVNNVVYAMTRWVMAPQAGLELTTFRSAASTPSCRLFPFTHAVAGRRRAMFQ